MYLLNIFIPSAIFVSMAVSSFVVQSPLHPRYQKSTRRPSRALSMAKGRQDITIPLLDLSDSDHADEVITPLPSSHLPSELATLHLYGMELTRPIHKMMIDSVVNEQQQEERMYGYIVEKPDPDTLVGAIGCTAEILVEAHPKDTEGSDSEVGDDSPIVVLCRGSYRFKVKEVVKTFPYPVAIVDELVDEEPSESGSDSVNAASSDSDDDIDEQYYDLDATELVRRTMVGLKTLVDQKLENRKPELSPLEQSILEESGAANAMAMDADSQQAEEMAAVFDIFQSSLIDIAPMPVDRSYAIAMLAAEMANVDNDVRRRLIAMTDGIARMRIVLQELEEEVSMNKARKVADTITDEIDEGNKDLKVGSPELPPWVTGIKHGTQIEYFWNEQEGWCRGVIDGEPMKVLDELIVTVRFEDGETHRLPITPDEKVRWRPPQDR